MAALRARPYVFSQDSIKEFQSSVSGYSAEFGNAAGGQVNAITKSGSNTIHGDLFYYLRYPALNALDPYSKWQALHTGITTRLQVPADADDAPAAAVRRLGGRPDHQGQALLLLHLRWLPQGEPDCLHVVDVGG